MSHNPSAEYVINYLPPKKFSVSLQHARRQQAGAGNKRQQVKKTHFVSSKTIMQFDHSDVVPTHARLFKNLIRQATCHSIANRIHGTPTSERVQKVGPESGSDQLDRLIFELVGPHKVLVRNDTARGAVLLDNTPWSINRLQI
jgi:hypothetical protein